MSVRRDKRTPSRTISVFVALSSAPPPASDTHVFPSGAEALDVTWARHSSASRTVSGSGVPDLFRRKSVLENERNVLLHDIVETSVRRFMLT